jgi:hypothetical protein
VVYAPTITRYFHHSDQNTDNQNVALNIQYPFQRLTLNLSESYAQITGINQDSNLRTTQTSSATSFGGTYDIDDKLSFNSQLQEVITTYPSAGSQGGAQGQGDTTSSINSALSYHLTDKITLGPGVNVGVEKPQGAQQDTFEQGLFIVNYQPTAKISLFGQGGAEFLQYDHGGQETDPIFSAGLGYTPFDSTVFSLNASQVVRPSSADSTQRVTSTGFGASASQRFLQRFLLNLSFNYSHDEDQSGGSGASQSSDLLTSPGSTQESFAYRPSLSFAPTAWTSIALYYQYLDNESNTPGAAYHDNQMGLSVSAQF